MTSHLGRVFFSSLFPAFRDKLSLHELRKYKLVFISHVFRLTIADFIKEFYKLGKQACLVTNSKKFVSFRLKQAERIRQVFLRCCTRVTFFGSYMYEHVICFTVTDLVQIFDSSIH